MRKLYIIICEDEKIFAENLKKNICNACNKINIDSITLVVFSGEEFWKLKIPQDALELIFMDYQLGDMTGYEITKRLIGSGRNKNIVFVTGLDGIVYESQEYFPFAFIQKKDINEPRITQILSEYLRRNFIKKKLFSYMIYRKKYDVLMEDILQICYYNHQVEILLTDKSIIKFRGTIEECIMQLDNHLFFRTNPGTIVNLQFCIRIEKNEFILKNGSRISIARSRKSEAEDAFMRVRRMNL